MRSIILIEKNTLQQWRVVERACTRNGLSADYFSELSEPTFEFRDARKEFDRIKPIKPQTLEG